MEENSSEEEAQLGRAFDVTPLAANAASNHEFVITYVNAGFTRAEAIHFLTLIMWFGLMKDS